MTITVTAGNIASQQGSKNAAITAMSASDLSVAATDTTTRGTNVTRISRFIFKGSGVVDWAKTYVETKYQLLTQKDAPLNSRHSLRLATSIRYVDDVLLTTEDQPLEVTISWNHAATRSMDQAALSRTIQAAVALVLQGFDGSTGVPAGAVVTNLNLGLTQSLT